MADLLLDILAGCGVIALAIVAVFLVAVLVITVQSVYRIAFKNNRHRK